MDIKKLNELYYYDENMSDEELLELLVDMTLVNNRRIEKLERDIKILKAKLNTQLITFSKGGK